MIDKRSQADRILVAQLTGEVGRHAKWRDLTSDEEATAVAELRELAAGRADLLAEVVEFARSIGMEPIELKKEQPGYVLNSLTVPFLFAALDLLVKDVADPATIDKTWRIATGAPAGPFQMLDVIGLNTVYNIAVASPDETVQAAAKYLKERYLDRGKLGQASGEGFYRYPVTA
jgi:3-hydroxyacyl-CoA dehydrogenase